MTPTRRPSPSDLTAARNFLSHQIVLCEEGWRDGFDAEVLIEALYDLKGELHPDAIVEWVHSIYDVVLDDLRLRRAIERLRSTGVVRAGETGGYALTEDARKQAFRERRAAADRNRELQQKLEDAARHHCPDVDTKSLWDAIHSHFLTPLVAELGARTIGFLLGESPTDVAQCAFLKDFLKVFPKDQWAGIQAALDQFFDFRDPRVTGLVYEGITRRYLVEAASLTHAQLDALQRVVGEQARFTGLCDTNVVLAALGMQDEPVNEVVANLLGLPAEVGDRLGLELFVLPDTVMETRKAIAAAKAQLERKKAGSNEPLNSLAQACERTVAGPDGPSTEDDFFDGPADTLLSKLGELGIHVYPEDASGLATDPEVLALLEEWQAGAGPRGASTHDDPAKRRRDIHDVTLLALARRKRVPGSNVANAQWWVITFDTRLRRFDAARTEKYDVPTAIPPDLLSLVVTFWTARSEKLEQAVLSTVRPPFVDLLALDALYTSTKIRDKIETNEADAQTVKQMLSQALGTRMKAGDSEEGRPGERLPGATVAAWVSAHARLYRRAKTAEAERDAAVHKMLDMQEELDRTRAGLLALSAARAAEQQQEEHARRTSQETTAHKRMRRRFYGLRVPLTTLATSAVTGTIGLGAGEVVELHPLALWAGGSVAWSYLTLRALRQQALSNPAVRGRWPWNSPSLTAVLNGLHFVGKDLLETVLKRFWTSKPPRSGQDEPSSD